MGPWRCRPWGPEAENRSTGPSSSSTQAGGTPGWPDGWVGRSPIPDLDRAALNTHWVGAKFVEGIEEGLLQICYLGGEKKGWIWVIPVGPDRLSIGVVLNHAYIREQKAKLTKRGVKDWQRALYVQELMTADFVRDILEGAEIAQPLMFNGNYSYLVERKFGPKFALIGHASTFIDPIFASGVFLSMNSARLVTNALHEALVSGDEDFLPHLEGVYSQINGAYSLVDKAIRMFYNPKAINWAQVGGAAKLIHQQSENALAIGHFLLAGDFFSRHAEYSKFIDLLEDERNFKTYKKLVMDREEFQSSSCGSRWADVFAAFQAQRHVSEPMPEAVPVA